MQKLAAAEEAVARVVAVDHAFDPPEVRLVAHAGAAPVHLRFGESGIDALDALARLGMRGQERRQRAVARHLAGPLEGCEHVGHLAHVVVVGECVAEAEIIGLALGVTPVLQKQEAETRTREVAELRELRHQDHAHDETDLPELLPADLLDRVARRDMADLVADHACQLRLRVHQ